MAAKLQSGVPLPRTAHPVCIRICISPVDKWSISGIESRWHDACEATVKQKQRKHARLHMVKGHAGKKPRSSQSTKSAIVLATRGKPKKRAPTPKLPSRETLVARNDADLEQLAGVPDHGQIGKLIGRLEAADREAWNRIRELLALHLGSAAAARLWLVTPSPGFATTPLDEIRNGRAKLLLTMLESQWGLSPTYV